MTVAVPELVNAINIGVQTAFQKFDDINTKPFWLMPWKGWKGYGGSPVIPSSEFQVTSPIIGTVNMVGMNDVNGVMLPDAETMRQGRTPKRHSTLDPVLRVVTDPVIEREATPAARTVANLDPATVRPSLAQQPPRTLNN